MEPFHLTDLFARRVLADCGKTAWARLSIQEGEKTHYAMLLFAGRFRTLRSWLLSGKGAWRRAFGHCLARTSARCWMRRRDALEP